jgi:hypothetical protein
VVSPAPKLDEPVTSTPAMTDDTEIRSRTKRYGDRFS